MPLVDERGRLFGRVNIIDATLVGFLIVLLPIVYTAARLFRVPKPEVERVEPASQMVGPGRRIRLYGRNFRPYLKALPSASGEPFVLVDAQWVNSAGNVLVETSGVMEIKLPDLSAGTYDVHLFDQTQEVVSFTRAFTLTAPSQVVRTVQSDMLFFVPIAVSRLVNDGDLDISDDPLAPRGDRSAISPATLRTVHIRTERVPSLTYVGGWNAWLRAGDVLAVVEAAVDVPTIQNPSGVREYLHRAFRAGDSFTFRTRSYSMTGIVTAVRDDGDPSAPASGPDAHRDAK